jgi:hypothetical protein
MLYYSTYGVSLSPLLIGRLAVYRQSVRLGDKHLETHDQDFLKLKTLIYEDTNGMKPLVTEFVT